VRQWASKRNRRRNNLKIAPVMLIEPFHPVVAHGTDAKVHDSRNTLGIRRSGTDSIALAYTDTTTLQSGRARPEETTLSVNAK